MEHETCRSQVCYKILLIYIFKLFSFMRHLTSVCPRAYFGFNCELYKFSTRLRIELTNKFLKWHLCEY